jgi:rubrerythrin
VNSRCPYCARSKLSAEFSLAQLNPELSKTWDTTLNAPLTPETVGVGAHKKAWWICPQCNQSFYAWISYKAKSNLLLCRSCSSGHKSRNIRSSIANSRGSLAVRYPDLLYEWDYQKNIDLNPENISSGSGEKAWWICSQCNHSWESVIQTRTKNSVGCPSCANLKRVNTLSKSNIALKGSLQDNFPYTASLWHPNLNGKLTPREVTARSGLKVWWLCPSCNQSFERQPDGLRRCPLCKGKMYV